MKVSLLEGKVHNEATRKYIECLNDLMDYFILADIDLLSSFVDEHQLSDDLIAEFTTTDYGDAVVDQGVILPIRGIENFPYTVYFNASPESVFSTLECDIQHRKSGYFMEVTASRLYLLTMPLLRGWSEKRDFIRSNRPSFDIENGYYAVEVVCGETLQDSGWEPTIEFLFDKRALRPKSVADISYSFDITSREY